MSIFICEKCGNIDNTALHNNYWHAAGNKYYKSINKPIRISYKPEYEYFEDHVCCSLCCDGIEYRDGSGVIKRDRFDDDEMVHWSKIGKEELLKMEKDRDLVNATSYLKSIGEL